MSTSSIKIDLSKLNNITTQLKKNYYAKVGILADKPTTDGVSLLLIGMVQMFGSITRNIPARDFLRLPLITKKDQLVKEITTSKQIKESVLQGNMIKAFTLIGLIAEGIIQDAFDTGGFGKWKKLKQATIKAKGSDAILIDTGELRRAITSKAGKDNGG